MMYLVIYDVQDDRERLFIMRTLQAAGLRRVEYSSYLGPLDLNDAEALAEIIHAHLGDRDSSYFVPLTSYTTGMTLISTKHGVRRPSQSRLEVT